MNGTTHQNGALLAVAAGDMATVGARPRPHLGVDLHPVVGPRIGPHTFGDSIHVVLAATTAVGPARSSARSTRDSLTPTVGSSDHRGASFAARPAPAGSAEVEHAGAFEGDVQFGEVEGVGEAAAGEVLEAAQPVADGVAM